MTRADGPGGDPAGPHLPLHSKQPPTVPTHEPEALRSAAMSKATGSAEGPVDWLVVGGRAGWKEAEGCETSNCGERREERLLQAAATYSSCFIICGPQTAEGG